VNPGDLGTSDPRRLADLLEREPDAARVWTADELAAVLRHQLAVPLHLDLDGAADDEAMRRSFGDLLADPHPPVNVLDRVKLFAKAARTRADGGLPPEVATVLYYASIAAADARCGRRITRLADAALREGYEWVLAQPWAGDPCAAAVREGLAAMVGPRT
jgi:hypothetical protein